MNYTTVLSVSQLNFYIKSVFESDYRLTNICISGEISNYVNHYRSGHCYFTLKDEDSSIKAIMFASNVKRLSFAPCDGMKVIVKGKISVFERDGVYQIYVDNMQPDGYGVLAVAFEQLKNKLSEEGLFDNSHKKNIPEFPNKIGVITSDSGAAIRDVMNVITRRYPLCEIVIYPVMVQGSECTVSNIEALKYFNETNSVDVLIICRGGGSIEDLWGYNDERFVREIFNSEIPIISGVGHETDFTLCDFVADVRASTPSVAGELAVPDIEEIYGSITAFTHRCITSIENIIGNNELNLNGYLLSLKNTGPDKMVIDMEVRFKAVSDKFFNLFDNRLNLLYQRIDYIYDKLLILNPVNMLKNGNLLGFCNDKRLKSVKDIKPNDSITLTFIDGTAECIVNEINIRG